MVTLLFVTVVSESFDGIFRYVNTSVKICDTTGAAIFPPKWLSPCGPYSVSNTTNFVFSTGAIAKNDATYPFSGWFGSASDVPVFPPIVYPSTLAYVPPPFSTTSFIMSFICVDVSFEMTCLSTFVSVFCVSPVSLLIIFFTTCGVTITPSFAIALAAFTSCIGVIVNLCPNDIVASSTAPTFSSLQNVLVPSLGKSIPVLSKNP